MTEQEHQKERLLDDLRGLNDTLEKRVRERTAELATANQKLMVEMTEHKRADARLQELQGELYHASRLSAAGQMAATLAHELSQPLTATASSIGAARRLLTAKEVDFSTVHEVMGEAAEQAKRAGQIVRRLRDFMARGGTEKRLESVVTMVEEASALSLVGVEAVGVTAQFGFDPEASTAFVDRIQIQQVLANLMRNAIEAMAGRLDRKIEVRTVQVGNDLVEIAVVDTGPGLPKHVADRLFQPFVSTKRNGMGLGLSICRSIVESNGGTLWCEANPAGGTVFRFTLPAAMTEHEAGAR
jgi:C4-dicarboxylate-specific signal transduction histidine kinase